MTATTVVQVALCPFCHKRIVYPEAGTQEHLENCRPARLALGEHVRTARRQTMIATQRTMFTTR